MAASFLRFLAAFSFAWSVSPGVALLAQDSLDIPVDAPQDALMAAPDELQTMLDWANAAFTGHRQQGRDPAIGVELVHQDFRSHLINGVQKV